MTGTKFEGHLMIEKLTVGPRRVAVLLNLREQVLVVTSIESYEMSILGDIQRLESQFLLPSCSVPGLVFVK